MYPFLGSLVSLPNYANLVYKCMLFNLHIIFLRKKNKLM